MDVEFAGAIFQWRGPAPYFYVAVPGEQSARLRAVASRVTYGWGVLPVQAHVGDTVWETSLFPKDGRYLLPLKDAVRRAEQLDDGDVVAVRLALPGID
jgi:hypothetical protein